MTDRLRRSLLAVVIACGLAATAPAALASDGLPGDLAIRIEVGGQKGRVIERGIWDARAGQTELGNRALSAIVIEAIAQQPGFARKIVAAAVAADPDAAPRLLDDVRAAFPWFTPAPVVVAASSAPASGDLEGSGVELLASETSQALYIPVEKRPPDWPILPEEGGPDGYADIDPLRPINTVFFYMNGTIDYLFFEPLAKTYEAIMPDVAEDALGRAFDNLSAPITFINDLLQLEFENAGITLARFLLNSTVGVGGLIDVAVEAGLPPHKADFGQTLHRYGVGDGIFLVLPLFGGTTLRDAVGLGFDLLVDPRSLVFDDTVGLGLSFGEGIVRRAEVIGPADFLEAYAQDHYEAARAWNYQQREHFLSAGCDQPSMIICIGDFSK